MASSVRDKSPAADFNSILTSNSVLMFSLKRRTTKDSFSATRLSLRRECGGNDRFRRANKLCNSLNSVRDGSDRLFNNKASIIESIARPAEADDLSASVTSKRSRMRPELLQHARLETEEEWRQLQEQAQVPLGRKARGRQAKAIQKCKSDVNGGRRLWHDRLSRPLRVHAT
eukprot:3624296-Pleurochrysis_carterae.AAC.1